MPVPIIAIAALAISTGMAVSANQKAAQSRKRIARRLNAQSDENKAFFNKEHNTKYLDTEEGASQYQGLKRMLKRENKRVDNSVVKTGGTAESALAQKEQTADAVAKGASQLSALGTRRKDNIRRQYLSQKRHLDGIKYSNMMGRVDSAENLSQNAATFGSSVINAQGAGSFEGGDQWISGLLKKQGAGAGGNQSIS